MNKTQGVNVKNLIDAIKKLPLDDIKRFGEIAGYRFEVDPDGTELMYDPDGRCVLTARKTTQNAVKIVVL